MKKINNFYISWLLFSIGIYMLLLCKDIFVSVYVFIYYDYFNIDFSFKKAFIAWLWCCIPGFIIHWLFYKYGPKEYRE